MVRFAGHIEVPGGGEAAALRALLQEPEWSDQGCYGLGYVDGPLAVSQHGLASGVRESGRRPSGACAGPLRAACPGAEVGKVVVNLLRAASGSTAGTAEGPGVRM